MTTTQPFLIRNTQNNSAGDSIDMTASPFAQYDDIDFDLDDEFEQFASNDKMTDDANNDIRDDSMKDNFTHTDDATGEEDADLVMDPVQETDDHDFDLENPLVNDGPSHDSHHLHQVDDTNKFTTVENAVDLERDVTFEDEDFLLEEEDGTDHDTNYSLTNTIAPNTDATQHNLGSATQMRKGSAQAESFTNSNNNGVTDVVDFALEALVTSGVKSNNSQNEVFKDTPAEKDDNAPTLDETVPHLNTSDSHGELFDKRLPADQQPDIVPDESDTEEHDSTSNPSTATHLHPITLRYEDQDMSLFPPLEEDDSATYFLGDASLAFEPIEKLLNACRDLLGESIGHDDEMVIDIPSLGLHICEDSKYANKLTLAQIVDTYMLLSQNENLSSIKPLYCELSHRVCLTSQMAYLVSSAREGKKYTDIMTEHMDTPGFGNESAEYDDTTGFEETDTGAALADHTSSEETHATIANSHEENSEGLRDDVSEALQTHKASPAQLTPQDSQNNPNGHHIEKAAAHEVPAQKDVSVSHNGDAESQSSHTVEGDHEQTDVESFDDEEAELAYPDDFDLGTVDDDELDDDVATEPTPLYAAKEEDAVHTSDNKAADLNPTSHERTNTSANNLDVEANTADKLALSNNLLATPSKSSNIKRKFVDEEDDFLEIDISTPEPKRTRPS